MTYFMEENWETVSSNKLAVKLATSVLYIVVSVVTVNK